MAGNSTESGRSVTSKITSILLTFTEGSEHSLTEIARLAGLPISTAHRLTSELASWRLLERTEDDPSLEHFLDRGLYHRSYGNAFAWLVLGKERTCGKR